MKNTPSAIYLLEKGFSFAVANIWRNKILSLATVFVIAIIIFIFNIILSINFIANDAITNLNKKVDTVIYLKDTTDYTQTQEIIQALKTVEGVENMAYTSKEQALSEMQKIHPELSTSFEKYDLGNPLPASLNITTADPKFNQSISDFLNKDQYRAYLSNVTNNDTTGILSSVSKNLLKVSDFTRHVIFWLIMTFVIGGALIILNALQITIFSRKQEIAVMKLVGASHLFIRLPFIIEAIFYGLLSVIISFIMLFLVSKNLQVDFPHILNYMLIEVITTILLCTVSSLIAVHEHLISKDL